MSMDLGFSCKNKWFRYRAAAILIEDGCALFAGNARSPYCYSVGGAVQHGETAQEAVCREVLEETGVAYEVDRLAIIHENFFCDTQFGQERECHEICFYFRMKPRGSQNLNSHSYSQGVREYMYWLPIDQLDQYRAYPSFLQDYLSQYHSEILHIVTDDRPVQKEKADI